MDERQTVDLCGRIGKILLQSGAETSRVEDTVERIGAAAGVPVACHATMTAITVGFAANTLLVKVQVGDFDLRRVDAINALSRRFVAHQLTQAALADEITKLIQNHVDYSWWQKILGAGAVSVAPMLVFKATWHDLDWAILVGIAGYLAAQCVGAHTRTPYLAVGVGGAVIGAIAQALMVGGLVQVAANVVISALMPLVPGVALTNALRELSARQTISGLVRAADAVMIAGAIGAGVVLGMALIGGGR